MIIFQKLIFRADLQANPHLLYVFGDNAERKGFGGQAKEMRGEPNAIGIRTKWHPTNVPDAFFSDAFMHVQNSMIEEDLARIEAQLDAGRPVVFPIDGVGTGLADLARRSPATNAYFTNRLQEIYTKGRPA